MADLGQLAFIALNLMYAGRVQCPVRVHNHYNTYRQRHKLDYR